jgi:hypothetical protein
LDFISLTMANHNRSWRWIQPWHTILTGKDGYCFIVKDGQDKRCLVVEDMAGGAQSRVQLCLNMAGEMVVRKCSKGLFRKSGTTWPHSVMEAVDTELRILDHLNTLPTTHPALPDVELKPRWITALSWYEFPTRRGDECYRISYWKWCNGGNVGLLFGMDMLKNTPICVIARMIHQVCETLEVMYQCGMEAVYHCDLHLYNIFVHWPTDGQSRRPNFFIGDFGWARTASEALLETECAYGRDRGEAMKMWRENHNGELWDMAPETAKQGKRRICDLRCFLWGLSPRLVLDHANITPLQAELRDIISELDKLREEDDKLTQHTNSRPPSLMSVVQRARALEEEALTQEEDTEFYKDFVTRSRARVQETLTKAPFIIDQEACRRPANTHIAEIEEDVEDYAQRVIKDCEYIRSYANENDAYGEVEYHPLSDDDDDGYQPYDGDKDELGSKFSKLKSWVGSPPRQAGQAQAQDQDQDQDEDQDEDQDDNDEPYEDEEAMLEAMFDKDELKRMGAWVEGVDEE